MKFGKLLRENGNLIVYWRNRTVCSEGTRWLETSEYIRDIGVGIRVDEPPSKLNFFFSTHVIKYEYKI